MVCTVGTLHTSSIVVADELRSMSTRRAERGRGATVRLSASSSATSRAICASVVNSVEKSLKLEGSFGPRFRFTSGGATSRSGLRANRLFLVRCLELVRWSSVVGDSAIMRSSTATSRPAPAPGHKATQSSRRSRYFVNMIYARQRSERGPASRRRLQDASPAPNPINAFTFKPGKSHLSALRTPQYHVHDTNDSTVAWHRGKSRLLNSASRIRGIASNFRQKKIHLSTGVLSSRQVTKFVPRGFRGVPGLQQSPGLPRVPNTRLLMAPYTAVMISHGSAPVESLEAAAPPSMDPPQPKQSS